MQAAVALVQALDLKRGTVQGGIDARLLGVVDLEPDVLALVRAAPVHHVAEFGQAGKLELGELGNECAELRIGEASAFGHEVGCLG